VNFSSEQLHARKIGIVEVSVIELDVLSAVLILNVTSKMWSQKVVIFIRLQAKLFL